MPDTLIVGLSTCFEPVMTWDPPATADLPRGSRGPWYVPCGKPVYRHLLYGYRNDKPITKSVCFDHSPNARRPTPAGR